MAVHKSTSSPQPRGLANTGQEPVLWCTVHACGEDWPIWISNHAIYPSLKGNEGLCIFDEGIILINADIADDRKPAIVFHEIMHVAYQLSGYEHSIAVFMENSSIDEDVRNEARICGTAPILFTILNGSGFFKLPPIPKEAAKLVIETLP